MTPPTIEQRVQAQEEARNAHYITWGNEPESLLTADELRAVLAELAALREDKARLDWLEKYDWSRGFGDEVLYVIIQLRHWNGDNFPNMRAAIDAARKEAAP